MSLPTQPAVAPQVAPPKDVSLLHAVVGVLRGRREDYTRLPLERAILLLAIPMGLELLMESAFGLVDIYFVGKLGPEAVAAVGLTGGLIVLVVAVALGLSIGAAATVARRIGAGDTEAASHAAGQAILAGVAASIPLSAAGAWFAPDLLRLMGGSPDVVAGWPYTAMLFGGSITLFLIFLNNAIFRGSGDAAFSMRSLWIANAFNIVLDPCLIFGLGPFPEMGLVGAAVATTIGRGFGVAFQLWILAAGERRVALRWRHLRPDPAILRRLLSISSTGMLQYLVGTASWLGIIRIISLSGDTVLAGYTIALRLMHFAILPTWGMSNAAATMVGQNLGAGDPDRAEKAVWVTARYNLRFLGTMAVIFWVFTDPLVALFTDDPATADAAALTLRFASLAHCFTAFSMAFSQAFNGAGDAWTPTKINFCVMWLLQIPLAYLLAAALGYGLPGAMSASMLAMMVWAAVGSWVFQRGAWKHREV